jgi:predicted O-methyltransferase YrrM
MNAKAQTLLAAFFELPTGAMIVEIGCIRFGHEIASDGWSTVYLARAAAENGWTFHSVDCDLGAVGTARAVTADLPCEVHHADGAEWLGEFEQPIDGLYLDGALDPGQAVEQYRQANLAKGAVVVIDDVQAVEGHRHGKATELLAVLERDGFGVNVTATERGYLMAVSSWRA